MPISIIQQIPDAQDRESVRNEWEWLVEPLASTISLPVNRDPTHLYVDPDDFAEAYRFAVPTREKVEQLGGDWDDRFRVLVQHSDLPHVLLGSVGVGKTSWINRFLAYLKARPDVSVVHYDHHVRRASLEGQHLTEVTRMRCLLHSELLREIQDACRARLSTHDVFKYDPNAVADDPAAMKAEMVGSMRDACKKIQKHHGHWLFFIVDNLDEYSRDLQYEGVSLANHLASWDGITCIVSLRPETLHSTRAQLFNARTILVPPASLEIILRQRLAYLWSEPVKPDIKNILSKFKKHNLGLTLLWAPEQIDQNPKTLKDLHRTVVQVITENKILEEALKQLHNHNMRQILEVVSCLLLSGFFSERLIETMKQKVAGEGLKGLGQQYIITTYLRGPYKRYRGRTEHYRVRQLNIIDVPGVPTEHMLVGIRILQLLTKQNGGIRVETISERLSRFLYPESEIRLAIIFLAKTEFIRDVGRQKLWASSAESQIVPDDEFIIAPAGQYLLSRLLNEFAFRYCEAMADVTSRPRQDGRPWATGRRYVDLVFNACGMLELFVFAGEHELRSVLNSGGTSRASRTAALKRFQAEFGTPEVLGRDFLVTMGENCHKMARFFSKDAHEYSKDFEAMTQLTAIFNTIGRLRDSCARVHKAVSYL